jgi:ligand-binding sensor domain-containing protein/two-component sensor histidine kinase
MMAGWEDLKFPLAWRWLVVVWLAALGTISVRAENYPFKRFTTIDGLAQNSVFNIRRDSRGFLWICTGDGLSRFDGARFVNFTMREGLSYAVVNDLVERRDGSYWVATNGGGVCRFLTESELSKLPPERAGIRFQVYQVGASAMSNRVNRLLEDPAGRLWATTDEGIFTLEGDRFERIAPEYARSGLWGEPILDRWGCVWFYGTSFGGFERLLVRRLPDGRFIRYDIGDGPPGGNYYRLLADPQGFLWLSGSNELILDRNRPAVFVFRPEAPETIQSDRIRLDIGAARPLSELLKGERLPLPERTGTVTAIESAPGASVAALGCPSDGHIWFFTRDAAIEFDREEFHVYSEAEGFAPAFVSCLTEDGDGNLWFGERDGSGAVRLTRNGCVNFSTGDGLSSRVILNIFNLGEGDFRVFTEAGRFHRFDGRRFDAGFVPAAFRRGAFTLTVADVTRDHEGDWWIGTNDGLYRFPPVPFDRLETTPPKAVYNVGEGLAHRVVKRVREDTEGNLWIGGPLNLQRWNRATNVVETPAFCANLQKSEVSGFFLDPNGALWVSFFEGGLARIRGGRADRWGVAEGLPRGRTYPPCLDRLGRLWVPTTSGGAARVDDPTADRISFRALTQKDGLSTDSVGEILPDRKGRLYFLTARGVDRYDLDTGRFRHFLEGDGIPNFIFDGFIDGEDRLWLASRNGLARLTSPTERKTTPAVFLGGLRIAGTDAPLPAAGLSNVELPELAADRNTLDAVFVGVHFVASDPLLIQYRLNDGPWSAPSDQRAYTFANLRPGRYRVTVRGVTSGGVPSRNEAVLSFSILPPLYLRWWFLMLAAAAVGLGLYGVYRYRVRRLLELERIRMRIAADLHDDIGSNLALIAGLGEMMSRQATGERLTERLSLIADTSRRSMDAMSDIVWAVNPKKDNLTDLAQRMRRFAEDTLAPRDIEFDFSAPEASRNWPVGAEIRREAHLIFKEAVNNAARHSGCEHVVIETGVSGGQLFMTIRDDGRGFDAERVSEGNGLASMRHRAEKIGGRLTVASAPGTGTTVTLNVPLRRF